MNEIIEEFAEQCTKIEENPFGMDVVVFDKEMFAELILKEAISSIDEQISFSDADTAGDIAVQLGMYNAKDIIMKHFGVKNNEND